MTGTVLVFEGQGATAVPGAPGEPDRRPHRAAPADAQRAIVRHQLGRARRPRPRPEPTAPRWSGVLGQSLGEISALVVAGALSTRTTRSSWCGLRAELPAKLLPEQDWTMASMTRLPLERAEEAAAGLDAVGRRAERPGRLHRRRPPRRVRRVRRRPGRLAQHLPAAARSVAPYHTPVMAPVAAELAAAAAGCTLARPAGAGADARPAPARSRTGAEAGRGRGDRAHLAGGLARGARDRPPSRWPDARWRECGPTASLHRFVWKNGLTLDWGEA